jgi:hypothetical protein
MRSVSPLLFRLIPVLFLVISFLTPGSAAAEEIQPLVQEIGNGTGLGPEYLISDISLPENPWFEPGMVLSPEITITNTGGDDTSHSNLSVSASLGAYPLISQNSTITPMKGGEKKRLTLEYLIPNGIPSREYLLFLTVSPDHLHEGDETKDSEPVPSGSLTIRSTSPGVRVNNCGCS